MASDITGRDVMRCTVCASTRRTPFLDVRGFSIAECGGCGVRLLDPQPSPAAIAATYGDNYFHNPDPVAQGYSDYVGDAANHRATFRRRLRYLPRQRRKRLLDIGAAAGFFVAEAGAAGWEAVGIELNATMAAHARDVLGANVRTGTFEAAEFGHDAFDAVTLWEVIEHLPDPRGTLRDIHEILTPGGFIALSTPDAGSLVARLAGRRWLGWRKVPEHLYFFDRKSLSRLLSEVGFEVVSMRYVSLVVPFGYAWERFRSMLALSPKLRLPARLAHVRIAVNPLYDLLVVARKPA